MENQEKKPKKSHLQYYKEIIGIFKKYIPKRIENELSEENLLNHQQFKLFMDSFPGIVGIIDLQTRNYSYMSNNVKNILGYEPSDFTKTPFKNW